MRIENKGANALNIARKYKPDLILLDIVLPDVPGWKNCSRLKRKSFNTRYSYCIFNRFGN
ncbi:MAG: hypothetical protein B6D55_04420 [Candidatus Omnitrophica bacterium 4484_70.2]|nr:MAG: hypothetical protein B6D55_04420 [Candidatus Omnitrophica bacterium 4484_70.2]